MHWRRIAFWSVVTLLSVTVLMAAWLWMADVGVLKPQIVRFISDKAGREFVINGSLSVDVGAETVLIAEDIRYANVEWAGTEDMAEIGRIEVRVDFWSLFSDQIRIHFLDIDDAELSLIRNDEGIANWELSPRAGDRKNADDEDDLDFLIGRIDIDRLKAVYVSPERLIPVELNVNRLRQARRDDDYLDIELDATLNDKVVRIDGEVGTWAALRTGREVRYKVLATLDTLSIESAGHIDELARLYRPSLTFRAVGPDIDHLTGMLGLGVEGAGDINLSGSLTPVDNGPLVLKVEGNLGATEIAASGTFSDLQDLEQIDFEMTASGPDLGRILSLAGYHEIREAPFMIDIDAERRGPVLEVSRAEMVFGEALFNATALIPRFPALDEASIHVQVEGPDIQRFRHVMRLPGVATGPFSIEFDAGVDDNEVDVLTLDLQTPLGHLHANGALGDAPDYHGSTVDFSFESENLHEVMAAYGISLLPDRPVKIAGAAVWTADGIQIDDGWLGEINDVSVTLRGLLAPNIGFTGSELNFELAGPDLEALVSAFTTPTGIPAQPYDVAGSLRIRNDGYYFNDVAGLIGTSTIGVDGILSASPARGRSQFDVTLEGGAFEEVVPNIGAYEVQNGGFAASWQVTVEPGIVRLSGLSLERDAGRAQLDFEFELPASERRWNFNLSGRGDDIRTILAGFGDFELNAAAYAIEVTGERDGSRFEFSKFDVNIGDAAIDAYGDLDVEEGSPSTSFTFAGSIPSLASFGTLDQQALHDQGLSWNANVIGNANELRLDNLRASLGGSDVRGSMHLQKGDIPALSIDIESDSIRFAPLLEQGEQEYDPTPEFDDGRLIPNLQLPLDLMRKLDATVSVRIGEFERNRLFMTNASLVATLDDGVLEVTDAGFNARAGRLDARMRIEPQGDEAAASLQVIARGLTPGVASDNSYVAMTGDIDVNLAATGDGLRSMLGNATGILAVHARGGRVVNNRLIQAIYGDALKEVLRNINPFYGTDPYTNFECIVAPLEFTNGKVTGVPNSFISTDKIRIMLKSDIDLSTERLTINVRTTPRRALSVSAGELVNPYMKLVGTLAEPRLAVDQRGALVSGGMALATGGLSVLARAALDRLASAGDPCALAAEAGRNALSERFPVLDTP